MRCRSAPTNWSACAGAAGCRIFRSATSAPRIAACRSSTPSAGTPASRSMPATTDRRHRLDHCGNAVQPAVSDDNGGRQIAGRVALHPIPGLILGGSGARGRVRQPDRGARGARRNRRGRLHADRVGRRRRVFARLLSAPVRNRRQRLDAAAVERDLPQAAAAGDRHVGGRPLQIRPGLYVAARLDHLGFSEIATGLTAQTWEAPVTRATVGGGYSIQRNLLLKAEFQLNTRDGGRVQNVSLGAAQLVFWF